MADLIAVLAPDAAGLARAAGLLRAGGLVAFPTETVYGLAADACDDRAVAGIFAAKGRPAFNPLIVHLADIAAARRIAVFDPRAEVLAAAFWPGPLTLVLPLRPEAGVSPLVTAGQDSVALRVPAHPVARALLAAFGGPLAAPSANPSGRVSPTTAAHVIAGLGAARAAADGAAVAAVIDGGACGVGVESTILGLGPGSGSGPGQTPGRGGPVTLLRAGGIATEEIEALLGTRLAQPGETDRPVAPGQLLSHYAPRGRVRLQAIAPVPGEVMVGFGAVGGDLNLSPSGDLTEAAANLFAVLHRLDDMDARAIAFAPVPDRGLGRAINDRLRRAAAPRP